MRAFSSPLAAQIECFLAHKRGLGFSYHREERHLREIDRVAATRGVEVIDEALVRTCVSRQTRNSRLHHLTVLRQLAFFAAMENPDTFVPPPRFLGIRRQQPVIRVLSRDESVRFLKACTSLPGSACWPQRGIVHGMALRTLLMTGLRRGEMLRLRDDDVDMDAGVITVRQGKFGKSRFVPLATDVLQRLCTYHRTITRAVGDYRPTDPFFPGSDGHRPCNRTALYRSFRRALDAAGIPHHGRGHGPRIHDLRHSFAVLRLLTWYEQGADLQAKLPLLSTYLGHVGLSTTQVYLHMTLDLVGEVARRQEKRFGHLITAEAP